MCVCSLRDHIPFPTTSPIHPRPPSIHEQLELAEALETCRRERQQVAEELESSKAAAADLREQVAEVRSLVTEAELAAAARVEEEREKATEAQAELARLQGMAGGGRGGGAAGARLPAGGGFEDMARSGGGAGRGGHTGNGDGGVSGEELMKLLEKAWEQGKEAAEKRMAFEKEEVEAQWRKVKGLKKDEQKAKGFVKAIAKGRVW